MSLTAKQKTFVSVREQAQASLIADLIGAQFRAALAEALAEDRAARISSHTTNVTNHNDEGYGSREGQPGGDWGMR